MKTLLLFNHASGLAKNLLREIRQLELEERCFVLPNAQSITGEQILAAAREHSTQRLIVAGGDGTLHQVVNRLAPHFGALEIGLVPCGTGNDFARSIGARQDHLKRLCTEPGFGRVVAIDLMRVRSPEVSYCINAASGGLGGEIASQIQPMEKKRWGSFAYWMSGLGKLADLHKFVIELELDNHTLEMDAYGVIVCNGRFVGGGFPIAPGANLNDGWLDITVIPVLPAIDLLAAGLNFAIGLPELAGRIQHHIARRVHLKSSPKMSFSLDGEATTTMDATFEVIHQAVKVIVVEQAPGLQPILSRLEPTSDENTILSPALGFSASRT